MVAMPRRLDGLAGGDHRLNGAQMRVERVDLQPLDDVADDDVLAVVREAGLGADIHHGAVGRGHHGIGRLAVAVGVQVQDVQALVHLPAVAADAAEAAAGPRLVGRGGREEFQFLARLHRAHGWPWEIGTASARRHSGGIYPESIPTWPGRIDVRYIFFTR